MEQSKFMFKVTKLSGNEITKVNLPSIPVKFFSRVQKVSNNFCRSKHSAMK